MGTAAPDTDNEIRAEAAAIYLSRQAIRILEQLLFLDKAFLHPVKPVCYSGEA